VHFFSGFSNLVGSFAQELTERGVKKILNLAFVFKNKHVLIREKYAKEKKRVSKKH